MSADPSDRLSRAAPPLTVHDLRRLGSDYLWRANAAMEHARRAGGQSYVPVAETAAEHAGQYVLSEGSLRGALAALDYQLAHVDPGENEALWREARAVLEAAIARAAVAH